MDNGQIVVVGGRRDKYPYLRADKIQYFHESDPDSIYYDEMCGHRFLLKMVYDLMDLPYVGLEHYRRAFDLTPEQINHILDQGYDCIVKELHGPYGDQTNLQVLHGCSRHHIDYYPLARKWVDWFPELKEQAESKTHWGCNMMICRPLKYLEIMKDEFEIIDYLLKTNSDDLTMSSIGYFCETILTPAMIRKHCRHVYVAPVKVAEVTKEKPRAVFGVLDTPEGAKIRGQMLSWLDPAYQVMEVIQRAPGKLFEYPAIKLAGNLAYDLKEPVLYIHTKGAFNQNDCQAAIREFWRREFSKGLDKYTALLPADAPAIAAPFVSKDGCTWFNAFVVNPEAGQRISSRLPLFSDRYIYESVPRYLGIPAVSPYRTVDSNTVFGLLRELLTQ